MGWYRTFEPKSPTLLIFYLLEIFKYKWYTAIGYNQILSLSLSLYIYIYIYIFIYLWFYFPKLYSLHLKTKGKKKKKRFEEAFVEPQTTWVKFYFSSFNCFFFFFFIMNIDSHLVLLGLSYDGWNLGVGTLI